MDRMSPSNRSIRMKHGTTIHQIMPLNRNTRFRIPEQNELQASSSYVPAQWRSPSSPSSLTVPTSYSAQVPIPPPGSRFSAPPYKFPPPYNTLSNMSTTAKFPKRSQNLTPPYVPPSSCPPYTTQSSMPVYTSLPPSLTYKSQSSMTSNKDQTSKFPKRSQYLTPPYVPPSSCPPYTTQSSMPVYTSLPPSLTYKSQSSMTSNKDQTSKFPKRSQYLTPPYVPPSSCPPYTTQSLMPVYTSLSPSLTYTSQSSTTYNTSQTSTFSIRSQFSASTYSPRYPTPTNSTAYSVPTYTSWSSTSTYNSSPSLCTNRRSPGRIRGYPSYSHFTFPRSIHYTMQFLGVMPQSSTQNSDPSSMNESSINVWPTKIGSVMQVSMENIYLVLAIKSIKSQPSDSTKTASNSCARNYNEKSEKTFMPLFENDNENIDTQLRNAWVYFNKLEIVDIQPNGKIKCICPMIQFEDLLKFSINDKRILVNLHRYYSINNILFETKYDYNSSPQNTIVTEKIENEVLQWLISLKMEEYDWFFNSLSLYEIENISPTNIQKFIIRSKSNNTISLEDQLKICCIVKKIKEWPVSLISIAMNLQEEKIDEEPFRSIVIPYITEIFLFPTSIIKHCLYEDIVKKSIISKMITLQISMANVPKIDTQPDTNSNMGDSLYI